MALKILSQREFVASCNLLRAHLHEILQSYKIVHPGVYNFVSKVQLLIVFRSLKQYYVSKGSSELI